MLCKSKAIVLHQIPYSENHMIVHFYTEQHGRLGCMVRNQRSKKSVHHTSFYQSLNQLQIEYYYKNNRQLQQLKESSLIGAISTNGYNYEKSAVVMFIAEVLYRIIREEEKNTALYQFLEHTLSLLTKDIYIPNYHLVFLIQLTKYVGIYPQNNYAPDTPCFDLAAGNFKVRDPGKTQLQEMESKHLHTLLKINFEDMYKVQLTGEMRSRLLKSLLHYYHFHLEGLGEIKSVKILQELFA